MDFYWIVLTVVLSFTASSNGNAGSESGSVTCNLYKQSNTYLVYDRSFLNTQSDRLCMLACLHSSILLTNTVRNKSVEIFVPQHASTHSSTCDFEFSSTLVLEFEGISYRLLFGRDKVETLNTQTTYCYNCDKGNWRLTSLQVSIENASLLNSTLPPTKIEAHAEASALSTTAGALTSAVDLQRGYRCSDKLTAKLHVTDAYDLATHHTNTPEWQVELIFYWIAVQPFLVTDAKIKDPVLCKDFTLFLALIITIPIIYFIIFVLLYRMRERYGCPPKFEKKMNSEKCEKKALVSSSPGSPCETTSYVVRSSSTAPRVTCTSPDHTETSVL